MLRSIVTITVVLLAASGVALGKKPAVASKPTARLAKLEKRIAELERQLATRPPDVSGFELPKNLSFCGEPVDLQNTDIRERMEREFYLMLGDRAQVVLWLKRARRVFPVVDKTTEAAGTCRDLKYLSVIESGLRPSVTSRASAHGWWQFMAATARQYGMQIDKVIDQRADLGVSTGAGIAYLVDLKKQFGSWSLAMAAYNTGPGRLGRSIKSQGIEDFWRLKLIGEAERYVPRVIAAKLIVGNPAAYGFLIDIEDGYKPPKLGYVKVKLSRSTPFDLLDIARGSGIDYRVLRRFNPELTTAKLRSDRQIVLKVPAGKEASVRAWVKRSAKIARAARSKRPKTKRSKRGKSRSGRKQKRYTVRSGDSLWDIAQRKSVTVGQLRKWNGLGRRDILRPGQKLIVSR